MKYNFIQKLVLLHIIFSLLGFLILPQICSAENFEEITPQEIKKYLEFPGGKAEDLLRSLIDKLTKEKINLESSGYSTEEERAVPPILRTAIRVQAFNYLLIDAPIEVVGKIVKYAIDIAQIILAKNISSEFWEKFEKETVGKAVGSGMKALMENEIRISPGAIKFKYPSYKGNNQEVIFQYLLVYKPTDSKSGTIEIRFYSPTSIEPPKSTAWVTIGVYHELTHNLPPFIVEIHGLLKNYKWDGDPTIEVTFPESVPDLGIRPVGFWDRNVLNPIKEGLKETNFVFQKIFGKTSKAKEKIQVFGEGAVSNIEDALKAIKNNIENAWQKFKETVSQFNPFGATVGFFSSGKKTAALESSLSETESELEKLRKEISLLEEKLKNEEGLRTEQKKKYESEVSGLTGKVDSLAGMVDAFNAKISEISAKEKRTQESKEQEKKETEETEKTEEEIILCQRKDGDLPKRNKIIFDEIAWMGTETSSNDEWIELKNISGSQIDLTDWQILNKDQKIKIDTGLTGVKLSPGGFLLFERTNDETVPGIRADLIYTGALKNEDEALYLFDKNCNLQDEIIADPNWPAGDKNSKRTMERKSDLSWQTSANPGGTPKSQNSSGYFSTSGGISGGGSSGGGGTSPLPSYPKILISEIQIVPINERFIELYNPNDSSLSLTNWYIQRKTETATSWSSLVSSTKFEGKTIQPRSYFLIAKTNENADIIFDLTLTENNSLVLKNPNGEMVDKVGWGNAQDFETAPTLNPQSGQSIGRKWLDGNYQDTDNNSVDFEIQTPTPKAENSQPSPEVGPGAILEVSPASLEFLVDFGKNPKSQILTLNSDAVLNWKVSIEYASPSSDGINWLRAIPNSGKTPSQILVSAFVSGLGPGEYQAFLNIESDAQNSPQKIPVTLKITSETFTFADHLIISEVQLVDNEFVELYNPTESDIDVSNFYFTYFSSERDWNDPWRITKFSEATTTTIPAKSYFLIGLKGYPEGESDWQPYSSSQLSDIAGSVAIFSCNPKYDEEENPISIEDSTACKIDALGWGETVVKEGEPANPPAPAGKSLARKLGIDQQGELNYIDTDNNQFDFEIQEISPKNLNSHSFSDLDEDGILDLFDEETVLDGEISLDANEYEFKNLKILENSKLIFNSDSSIEGFKGVKINAQNFILEENSSISADTKGYPAKEGPGAGKFGVTGGGACSGYNYVSYGSGGGYGGIGGKGGYESCGESLEVGISYGFLEIPLDLGSGGGNENGGEGGGGIIIDVVEKINLDGQISANGQDGNGGYYSNSGGGSGGGILISTNILEGLGKISANGGNGKADCCGGGGGGGRVAIYYDSKDNFIGEIESFGGQGYKSGGAGTIFLKSFKRELGDLTIDNGNFEGFTNLERDLGFDNFRVLNSAYLYLPEKLTANYLEIERATLESETQTEIEANQINLNESSSIILLPAEEFLKIKANNLVLQSESKIISNLDIESEEISIDSTSAILADGKGFSAGQGPGSGKVGQTGGGGCSGYNYCSFASGGGYGGIGGQGSYSSCGAVVDGGTFYGDLKTPLDFGSGGGGETAGAAGGAIQIVTNSLNLDGQISVNGENGKVLGACGGSGGGSGGSILIKTNILEGSGKILANGGKGYSTLGGGGAGGRIAIYYDSKDNFTGTVQSFGGGPGFKSGGPGTIFLKSPTQEYGDLIIDNNNFEGATQLAENYIFENLKISNSSHLFIPPENLTSTNLEVENKSILEVLGTATINVNQFLISQNSSLLGPSQIFVTINSDNLSLQSGSQIIANAEINTGDISIDSTSAISADGKGNPAKEGPGAGKVGMTGGGGCSGYNYISYGSGAGYGGQGGQGGYSSCHATVDGGLPYGNEGEPIDFGSGGGGDTAGAGGGAIQIAVLNNLTLDGQISVNGGEGKVLGYGGSGGGSGGSIYIITNTFNGSGQISANGGKGYDNLGGGGAGGRIAIYPQTNNFSGLVQALGGAGYQTGQDGTIFLGP